MKQWIAVEKLVAGIENAMSEREFLTQCSAVGVIDSEVIDNALDWLSVCGLLTN